MRSPYLSGSLVLLAFAGHGAIAAPQKQQGDHKHPTPHYTVHQQRADAVKQAFQISWDGYYKYAFPHDSLRPISNGWSDDRCVSSWLWPGGM